MIVIQRWLFKFSIIFFQVWRSWSFAIILNLMKTDAWSFAILWNDQKRILQRNHHVGSTIQASAGRRRPRRPGFPNSLFQSWDSCFVSEKVAHQPRKPWTKTRTSATTLGTGTRASKIQDGEESLNTILQSHRQMDITGGSWTSGINSFMTKI